jgi:Ca2+-binding RTX toxin-like protein
MKRFFQNFPGFTSNRLVSKKRKPASRRVHLALEALEDRRLMAAGPPIPAGISLNAYGTVNINCGDHDDIAKVDIVTYLGTGRVGGMKKVRVTLQHVESITVQGDTSSWIVDDQQKEYDLAAVHKINFFGYGGSDTFINNTSIMSSAAGGDGDDHLVGGDGSDTLTGGVGQDQLEGRGGPDKLMGGVNNDQLEGGLGDDTLQGDAGSDTYVYSGQLLGTDKIVEAANVDSDTLDFTQYVFGLTLDLTKTSTQTIHWLGALPDTRLMLSDASGIENVWGSNYGDTIKGNSRNNVIYGQGGDDVIQGWTGNDSLHGGEGHDMIYGDCLWPAPNQKYGGAGADQIFGEGGNDTIHGGGGDDTLYGGTGDDVMYAYYGNDYVYGQAGNDRLYGGSELDHLFGGANDDTIVSIGGGQSDVISGGSGFDSFWVDAEASEKITDLEAAEQSAGHEHRVAQFFSYKIAGQNVGAPSRELLGQALADPLVYDSVNHVYKDFRKDPLFASWGPTRDDIDQNDIPNCYFMAQLGAVAQANPDKIRQLVVDLGDGTYAVNFKDVTTMFGIPIDVKDVFIRVDGDLPTQLSNGKLCYAGLGQQSSIWAPIIEKAWAFYRNENGNYKDTQYWQENTWEGHLHDDHASLGLSVELDKAVWQYTSFMGDNQSGMNLLNDIKWYLDHQYAVIMTGPCPFDSSSTGGHSNAHAYTVVSVQTNGNGDPISLTLRNPYAGMDEFGNVQYGPPYTTISAAQAFVCGGTLQVFGT